MSSSVRTDDYYSDQYSPPMASAASPITGRHGSSSSIRSSGSNRSYPANHYRAIPHVQQQANIQSHATASTTSKTVLCNVR
ncbi:hypothetical protein V8B55DRAFT_1580386 [Mucor lusitanicus]